MKGTSQEDICTFMIVSGTILFKMGNISDKIFTENQNTNFYVHDRSSDNCAVCEIMWKHTVAPENSQIRV